MFECFYIYIILMPNTHTHTHSRIRPHLLEIGNVSTKENGNFDTQQTNINCVRWKNLQSLIRFSIHNRILNKFIVISM